MQTMRFVAVSCLLALLCAAVCVSANEVSSLDAASLEQSLESAIEAQMDSELGVDKAGAAAKGGVIPWVSGTKSDGTCTNGGLPGPDCVTSTYGLPPIDWPSSGSNKRRSANRGGHGRRRSAGGRIVYRLKRHPLWIHQRERFYRPRRAIKGRCPRTIRLTFHKGRNTDHHVMVREYGRLITPTLVYIHPRYAPRKYRITLRRQYRKYVMRLVRKKRSVCRARRTSKSKAKKCKALKKKVKKAKKNAKKTKPSKKSKKSKKDKKKKSKKAAKKAAKKKAAKKKAAKKAAKKKAAKKKAAKKDKKKGKKGKGKKGKGKKDKKKKKKAGKNENESERENENEERDTSLLSVDEKSGLQVRTALHSGVQHVAKHSYPGDARRFREDPGMLIPVVPDNTEEIIRNLPTGEAKYIYRLKHMIARNRGPEGPFSYHKPVPSFLPDLPNANEVLLKDRELEYLNDIPVVKHSKFVEALKTVDQALEQNDRVGDLLAKEWKSHVIFE